MHIHLKTSYIITNYLPRPRQRSPCDAVWCAYARECHHVCRDSGTLRKLASISVSADSCTSALRASDPLRLSEIFGEVSCQGMIRTLHFNPCHTPGSEKVVLTATNVDHRHDYTCPNSISTCCTASCVGDAVPLNARRPRRNTPVSQFEVLSRPSGIHLASPAMASWLPAQVQAARLLNDTLRCVGSYDLAVRASDECSQRCCRNIMTFTWLDAIQWPAPG